MSVIVLEDQRLVLTAKHCPDQAQTFQWSTVVSRLKNKAPFANLLFRREPVRILV